MSDSAGSKVGFFLLGFGIGSVLAILYVTRSGEESRDLIASRADEGFVFARRRARELRARADTLLQRSREIIEVCEAGPAGPGGAPHANEPDTVTPETPKNRSQRATEGIA